MQDNISFLRLQVFLARCGLASRRSCEKIILQGRISVNGKIITELGTKVSSNDDVRIDGKKIFEEKIKRYILLNKPAGYICSLSDEKDRKVAADLLKETYSERLYNIGRLDMFSEGLIIFTNDGKFASLLSHPSAELEKEYIVDSLSDIPEELASDFEKGIRIEGIFYKALKADKINSRRMKIVLIEGKNREIRNIFRAKRIGIKRLMRTRIGNIITGDLKVGNFRNLEKNEISSLLRLCKNNDR